MSKEAESICENCKQEKNMHSFPLASCAGVRETKFKPSTKIIYQSANLSDVMNYFAKDFEGNPQLLEFYVDTAKNKVIFKLMK